MNNAVVLAQFNKRSVVQLSNADLNVIVSMKSFSPEKICSAFSVLTGKDLGLKDLDLLVMIMDIAEALTPMQIPGITGPSGPVPRTMTWPTPGTIISSADQTLANLYQSALLN